MTRDTTTRRADIAELLQVRPRRRITVLRWLIGTTGLMGVALVALTLTRSTTEAESPQYVTESVTRGDLAVTVSATGKLQPTNTVELGSELSGLVDAVFADENATVRKGQILAQLDTSKLKDQIARSQASQAAAEARLAQAAATVKEAAANLERLREVSRLSGGKVPSQTEMESAEATLARAQGDRAAADASVADARATLSSDVTNLGKASIRSPIDGIVLTRSVEPGQTVAASLQVATLFTIAQDLRRMELVVDVDEADVGRVQSGQSAAFTVDAYPGRTYDAKVVRVAYGSTTAEDVVSYAADLTVDNNDLSLRPGMTASVVIASASVTEALLVPNAALRFSPTSTASADRNTRSFVSRLMPGPGRQGSRNTDVASATGTQQVWVLRDGKPMPVAVLVGQSDGRFTEVVDASLGEGQQVITESTEGALP